ncbi:hypothetical protein OM416_20480 [Paenibacillus sp. LS1]|uniref:hypothetical protein n=1 Tax=Paenibacillus sp. LS1 TaxID=2992120 RepID=UPI0022322A2D|nr:hypothetical protein [Paenibacillus sp. LS1]MCW3793975.1 hypothetical protein [Paenibacillus sp. LS1]
MRKDTAAIIARLKNREGVNYFPSGKRYSPKGGFVVTLDGFVCPLDSTSTTTALCPIRINEDNQLECDETVSATNTIFDVRGKHDLSSAVVRYNDIITEKLRNNETEDDEYNKIADYHAF